ncbi:MAG TPA: hypothetical protein VLL95_04010 [Phnomibacter sp.]|nr:hypothetical protein [Phnomibacter sp.]
MKPFLSFCLLLFAMHSGYSQLNAEQQTIKQTFFSFLKYYQQHETEFNKFRLYKGKGKNDEPPYHIQWSEAEKYFAYLRKNVPYVGEAYIEAERRHFKESEKAFKEYPDEEMPSGFDYDRWAGGQEDIDYTIKWYTSPKNIYKVKINGNKAELRIGGELWKGAKEEDREWSVVPFVKEKGKWKMADNVYPAD